MLPFMPLYMAANPTTTPDDYKRLAAIIKTLPEAPNGVVRLLDKNPRVEGMIDHKDPESIWLSREGTNWKSRNPTRIAGTLVHENAHTKGANEVEARRAQVAYLQHMITKDSPRKDREFLAEAVRRLRNFEAVEKAGILNK
jgi:hypothetical protein